MNRRELISLPLLLLVNNGIAEEKIPKFKVADRVKCYGKKGIIERVDTGIKDRLTPSLIHAAMFGIEVINEPFYLVRFEQPELEEELFSGFNLDGYISEVSNVGRIFKTILCPERALQTNI